jgi:hypothetical protein
MIATSELGGKYLDSVLKVGDARHAGKRKTPKRLDREIKQNLVASGQPKLAELFADPGASRAFAREMRHELQKKQTSEKTAAFLAARPFVVKLLEEGEGGGGRGVVFGRYPNESEAREVADRIKGWIEYEGRAIYISWPSMDHSSRGGT